MGCDTSARFVDGGFGEKLPQPRFRLRRAVERFTELLPVSGAKLKMPRFGDLLFGSHARALEDEVRDIDPSLFGTEANENVPRASHTFSRSALPR